MKTLILIKEKDLEKTLLQKANLVDLMMKRFDNIVFYSDDENVRKKLNIKFKSLKEALQFFKEDFIVILKPCMTDVDFERLKIYHKNHGKDVTIVLQNLIKGKTIAIYQINEKKEVVNLYKKRYISINILALKPRQFDNFTTFSDLIEQKIQERQIKAFVHTGFYYTGNDRIPKGFERKIIF